MTDKPGSEIPHPTPASPGLEQTVLERLGFAILEEQKLKRRWNIFFRLLFVSAILVPMLVVLMAVMLVGHTGARPLAVRYTALIELEGTIEPDSPASADNVIAGLRDAFESKGTVGVIIRA